jgi:GAF domain
MLNNLTQIGFGVGTLFPIFSIIIDLVYRDYSLSIDNLVSLYTNNPLHWVILSAPFVLGFTCYLLGKKISAREIFLQEVTESEKRQASIMEEYISQLTQGNLSIEVPSEFKNKTLSGILTTFRDSLYKEKLEAERRLWTNAGLAHFGDILRNPGSLEELSFSLVSNLARYLKCSQAALFIVQHQHDETFLELKGCYAYERRKFLTKRVDPGEGLLGQCYLEKRTILLYQVPPDYVSITSGLGQATPDCLVLSPLKAEGTVEGVIEIAGFKKLEQHEISFLEKVCESIAAVFKNIKTNEETRKLLEESQQQAETMQSQEEEMRQNLEELSATQEEMLRKEKEFTKIIATYKSRFGEIEETLTR